MKIILNRNNPQPVQYMSEKEYHMHMQHIYPEPNGVKEISKLEGLPNEIRNLHSLINIASEEKQMYIAKYNGKYGIVIRIYYGETTVSVHTHIDSPTCGYRWNIMLTMAKQFASCMNHTGTVIACIDDGIENTERDMFISVFMEATPRFLLHKSEIIEETYDYIFHNQFCISVDGLMDMLLNCETYDNTADLPSRNRPDMPCSVFPMIICDCNGIIYHISLDDNILKITEYDSNYLPMHMYSIAVDCDKMRDYQSILDILSSIKPDDDRNPMIHPIYAKACLCGISVSGTTSLFEKCGLGKAAGKETANIFKLLCDKLSNQIK